MNLAKLGIVSILACGNVACATEAERQADATEDRVERLAEANAAASGNAIVAFGMTEGQLLDADLVAADGTELGDIAQVRRNTQGAVDGLLVEIENSNPEKFVLVSMAGLAVRQNTVGHDAQTTLTAQQLAALPSAT